jgi:hypothetical protein
MNATVNTAIDKGKMFRNHCKNDNHTEDRCFKKLNNLSTNSANIISQQSASTANVILLCHHYSEDNLNNVINKLSKTFKVKYLGKLENFIGCKLIEDKDKTKIWIHQPKLLKHLKQTFGELVDKVREYKTPATPKETIVSK